MIPSGLTNEHILHAIELAASKPYASNRELHTHELVFEGGKYPVKVVVDLAELVALEGQASEERAREFLKGKRSDFNAVEAKLFLIRQGFPVNSIEAHNQDEFFQSSDLEFFQRMAGDVYDMNDRVSRNAGHFIADTVWEKSCEWGKRIEEQSSLTLQLGKHWRDRGPKGDRNQRIKKYTWYRLKGEGTLSNKIFYTVGVWGPGRQLIMKLDCQRKGSAALAQSQIAVFDQFVTNSGIGELVIEYNELSAWNWDRLLEASLSFINRTYEIYQDAMMLVERQHENVYARVCFNRLGWTEPSGKEGKSTTSRSSIAFLQERDYGFAPDEWLFDLDRIADDGFHYARIEPLTPESYVGKVYNIIFYAQDDTDNTWYWVGEIRNVEAIDTDLSAQISVEYEEKGWLQQQISQLQQWGGVMWEHYRDMESGQRFNIRFHVEDCTVYNYRPFADGEKPPGTRYNLVTREKEPETQPLDLIGGLDLTGAKHDRTPTKVIRKFFTGGYRELKNIHAEVQDAFMQQFPAKLPLLDFYSEVRKGGLYHRIDIVAAHRNGEEYIFYEVKTYPNVLQSIRVAIGQLLEYAFYPAQDLCSVFYIVSHIEANDMELQYLQHLSVKLSMQFGFIHFDRDNQKFNIQL